MTTSTVLPVEEYLRTSCEPEMEYVDGQLLDRHVGEYFHSRSQVLIESELGARGRERRFHAFIALRVRIGDEPRYRVPDVCVKALPYKVTPILDHVDLAIEIVSPDDETAEMLSKIADYVAAGIPYIWVIDPYKRTLSEVVQGVIRRPATTVLSTPLVGEVDFASIFQQLDEPTE
jgi:Uma2 family endonuclease